ncbi:MAG: peptidylprolyl isomerase [Planctomycetota bacterium]|jgi:hypothetical protein|nr:peptidylprolyl isomerase [Planctomycetota bacterium]
MKNGFRILLYLILAVISASCLSGEEFDIGMPRILLRRLQLCRQCGAALLVTRVQPGVVVRCPDCGAEQPRLRDEHLISQLYQMCNLCEMPLDSTGREAGDVIECGNCHTRQVLSPDAILDERFRVGKGYLPGFPPGKGDKTMLFLADAAANDMALAGLTQIAETGREDALVFGAPPLPLDAPPQTGPFARSPTAIPKPPQSPTPLPAPEAAWRLAPLAPVTRSSAAVDVPAVSVDMFGGPELPDLPVRRTASAFAALEPGDRLLARVDGRPITLANVDAIVLPALRSGSGDASPERETDLRRAVLDRLVRRELAIGEARRLGVDPDWDAVRRRAEELAPRLEGTRLDPIVEAEKEVVMRIMRDRVVAAAVTPEKIRQYYEERKGGAIRPGGLAIIPLCVFENRAGRADARDYRRIVADLSRLFEAGERFDAMRELYDELAPAAGMPFIPEEPKPREFFAEEVLRAVGDLPAGAVFGPVFLSGVALFGKITASTPPAPVSFGELDPVVRARLEGEAGDAAFVAWIRGLAENADIEIH